MGGALSCARSPNPNPASDAEHARRNARGVSDSGHHSSTAAAAAGSGSGGAALSGISASTAAALQRMYSPDSFESAASFASAHSQPASDASGWSDDEDGAVSSGRHILRRGGVAGARAGPQHSTAALLIDAPTVAGPLPERCLSPTFRRLSSFERKADSDGSVKVHSYSKGVRVLDSVTSLRGESLTGAGSSADAAEAVPLPAAATSLLKRAAAAYAGGKLLQAEAVARAAGVRAGYATLDEFADRHPVALLHQPARRRQQLDEQGPLAQQAQQQPPLQGEPAQPAAAAASAAKAAAAAAVDGAEAGIAQAGAPIALDLRQLAEEAEAARACLASLADTRGWASTKAGDLKVRYQHTRGSPVHGVRVEATYAWPADQLLSVTREFDVVGSFNRFAQDHSVLAEPSVFESIVYAGTWMPTLRTNSFGPTGTWRPFPMKPLELILSVRWADLVQEEGIILIVLADAGDRLASIPGAAPLPPKSGGRRRSHILPGSCGYMRPLPPGPDGAPRTKCVIMARLDTGLPYTPGFVVSFVLKVLSPFLFNATKRLLRESFASEDAELPRRIAAKPQLYGLVRAAEAEAIRQSARHDSMLCTLSCTSDASEP